MKVFKILISILLILILICGLGIWYVYTLTKYPKGEYKEYKIEVPFGKTYLSVSEELEEQEIIKSAKVFYYYSRYKKAELKSGVYTVNNKMTFDELHSLLCTGKQEHIIVNFPEGITISGISLLLEEKGVIESAKEFQAICKDKEMLSRYNIPSKTFEGYLFPDTYYFTSKMEVEEVLDLLVNNFFEKLATIENATELSNDELHEVVKLASIVEKEYKLASEAPLIASVFRNRLKNNDGLYSCATIIYIITEIQGLPNPGEVKYADLQIESPYNTYKYSGLTPTPISNPGLIALDAAINTPKTNYYFFRVNDEENGSHIFSTNFEDHVEAGY